MLPNLGDQLCLEVAQNFVPIAIDLAYGGPLHFKRHVLFKPYLADLAVLPGLHLPWAQTSFFSLKHHHCRGAGLG